jgi:predicted AAA+ superfamily ATPase
MQLSASAEIDIKAGETLIVFDEILEVRNGLASLKYFCENAREQHVVVVGSLFGLSHNRGESFPVGKVDMLTLYPMSYDEFLRAKGKEILANQLIQCNWEVIGTLGDTLEQLLREYYYVGGMPEAVLSYVSDGELKKVRAIQKKIIKAYEEDMGKHAGTETTKVRLVWESIVLQLAKENKKFIYGTVKKGARSRDLENAIQWILDAGLAYKVNRCTKPTYPLSFYKDLNAFKLYMLDVGLLGVMTGVDAKHILIPSKETKEFKGAVTENFVIQQLKTIPDMPIYYSKENSMLEVDFVVQTENRIIPVEVKAEENVKNKSMAQFIKVEFESEHFKGLRCSMKPYIDQGWMENISLYGVEGYLRLHSAETAE